MLAAGRLDAIIGTDINIALDARRLGLQGKVEPALYQPEQRIPLYIAISLQSPLMQRADELSRVLEELITSGRIDAAAAAHYLP